MLRSREHSFDTINVGTPAELLVRKIIDHHKKISAFTIFSYDLHVNSDDELQAVRIRPMRRSVIRDNGLIKLSDQIHKKIPYEKSDLGRDQEFGMAIASLVDLKWWASIRRNIQAHIPQLDFTSRSKQAILDMKKISRVLQPFPGFILETGNSLHYWGTELLSPIRWLGFLAYASQKFDIEELDPAFVEFSIRRGFSGLRIHSYGDIKPISPYVIARVGVTN